MELSAIKDASELTDKIQRMDKISQLCIYGFIRGMETQQTIDEFKEGEFNGAEQKDSAGTKLP